MKQLTQPLRQGDSTAVTQQGMEGRTPSPEGAAQCAAGDAGLAHGTTLVAGDAGLAGNDAAGKEDSLAVDWKPSAPLTADRSGDRETPAGRFGADAPASGCSEERDAPASANDAPVGRPTPEEIRLERLLQVTACVCGVDAQAVRSRCRTMTLVVPRQLFCYMAVRRCGVHPARVAPCIGRTRSTVIHSVGAIAGLTEIGDQQTENLLHRIGSLLPDESQTQPADCRQALSQSEPDAPHCPEP